MKIRTGFVSNSSSSSFLIYGLSGIRLSDLIVTQEILDHVNKNRTKYGQKLFTMKTLNDCIENRGIILDDVLPDYVSCHCPYEDNERHYVGISWDRVGGDETGNQFMEKTKKLMTLLFGEEKASNCLTHEEAWFNG